MKNDTTDKTLHSEAGARTAGAAEPCPIYWKTPKRLPTPESVDFGSIVEHMAHNPKWERALLKARATIGNRDPFDIKNRACRIVDDNDTYNKVTRDLIDELYNGDDLDALTAAVIEAETTAGKLPKPGRRADRGVGAGSSLRVSADETEEIDDDESEEVTELRERVSELEAEVDLWKRQPWVLEHDYPNRHSAKGRRRGESEVSENLDRLQRDAIVEYLAENTTGAASIGAILLMIEYLGALAFNKRFNDLDMAIDELRQGLVEKCSYTNDGIEALRIETVESVDGWINFRVTSDMQQLSERFQKYNERKTWRRDENREARYDL